MTVLETPGRFATIEPLTARFIALPGVPMVKPGDDIALIVLRALRASQETLRDGDVLVIAQKIVSKAQGRLIPLSSVTPSPRAKVLASEVRKDPRVVELILRESREVVRACANVLVVEHRLGFVMANAGIDFSNVDQGGKDEMALLLPEDPDGSCAELRHALKSATGADVAVIINDSHGRAFRNGTVGVAIGVSGLAALEDLRGRPDLFGRELKSTEVGKADEIASAASVLMGQADEGRPIVLARGLPGRRGEGAASQLVRAKETDLFRAPAAATPSGLLEQAADRLFRGRRSIRQYLPQQVSDPILEKLVHAGSCAPSAHNRQPWRFAVLRDMAARQRLARAMGARLRADRTRDGRPADDIERDVERSTARITAAPLAIMVCLTMEDMDVYPDSHRMAAEYKMAVQGTAMAVQNMLLAAHASGLGACVMCAPLFCPETVRLVLDIPPRWEPQALLTVGYPAGGGKPFRRRPPAEIMCYVGARP